MKTLDVLIKRANRVVEARAADVNRTLNIHNQLLTHRVSLSAAIEGEAAFVDASPLTGLGFAAFLDIQKRRIAEVEIRLASAEEDHQLAQQALNAAYAELKKLEYLRAKTLERERQEELAREQTAFDERSSQMHGRR